MKHAAILVCVILAASVVGLASMYFLVPQSAQTPHGPTPSIDDVRRVLHEAVGPAADPLQVELRGSWVRLRGKVPSEAVRVEAVRAVRKLPGITDVDDRLEVQTSVLRRLEHAALPSPWPV
ncbi:MAG TPA: BON domain-containing protein [Myxococcota bacterium]|nr:BON domain-containing protein [Myxococcota bacterium]